MKRKPKLPKGRATSLRTQGMGPPATGDDTDSDDDVATLAPVTSMAELGSRRATHTSASPVVSTAPESVERQFQLCRYIYQAPGPIPLIQSHPIFMLSN